MGTLDSRARTFSHETKRFYAECNLIFLETDGFQEAGLRSDPDNRHEERQESRLKSGTPADVQRQK